LLLFVFYLLKFFGKMDPPTTRKSKGKVAFLVQIWRAAASGCTFVAIVWGVFSWLPE
jgi:hypothetical protein